MSSDSKLPDFVQNLLKKIIQENNFSDYSVDIESGSQAGDGFSSNLYRITISEKRSDQKLNLVCKVAPQNENHRREFLSDITFKREALFYNTLMPIFAKFQNEKHVPNDKHFRAYPKCYGTIAHDDSEEYAIMLEDLRPPGFKMWDKAKVPPIELIRLTLRELGKFHGLSMALKAQRPEEFNQFRQITDIFTIGCQSKNILNMYHVCYDRAINSLRNEHHKNIMRHIKNNLLSYMENCLSEQAAGCFGVLNHGI